MSIPRPEGHAGLSRPRIAGDLRRLLDSASGQGILGLFGELYAAGQTIVMITHDKAVAQIASRIVQTRDGQIVEDRVAAA